MTATLGDLGPSRQPAVVNLCHPYVGNTDWEYSEFSSYDLGQAVAHMTIQAQAMGLAARQLRAFDSDGLTRDFKVPAHWEVTTMTAFGVATAAEQPHGRISPDGGPVPRDRRATFDLLWRGGPPLHLADE
jgi:hypothetical protein